MHVFQMIRRHTFRPRVVEKSTEACWKFLLYLVPSPPGPYLDQVQWLLSSYLKVVGSESVSPSHTSGADVCESGRTGPIIQSLASEIGSCV